MSLSECLVLGLLYEGHRYGHDIDRAIEQRNIRQWARISRVAIYQVLARLTERGWVKTETERDGRMPERTVYTLTPAGVEGMRCMVAAGIGSQEPIRMEHSVPVVYMHVLPPDLVLEQLQKRKALIAELRQHVETKHREVGPHLPLGPKAIIRHHRAMYRLEERWLNWLMRQIEQNRDEHGGWKAPPMRPPCADDSSFT